MKTHTVEELKLAQAKGCRIEYASRDWYEIEPSKLEAFYNDNPHRCPFRIHPADEWKARLPRLREGAEWHRNDFTSEMLEGGCRPLLDGEVIEAGDEVLYYGRGPWVVSSIVGAVAKIGYGFHCHRTRRPVPPAFLHPDELTEQPVPAQAPDFGEPWEWKMTGYAESGLATKTCHLVNDNMRLCLRASACVNALAGVPDPAEFVRQAMEMKEAIKEAHEALSTCWTAHKQSHREELFQGYNQNMVEASISKLKLLLS